MKLPSWSLQVVSAGSVPGSEEVPSAQGRCRWGGVLRVGLAGGGQAALSQGGHYKLAPHDQSE